VALLDGCIVWLPEVDLPPPHEPEAEQDVTFLPLQEITVLWPRWMLDRLAVMDRVGDGGGAVLETETPTVREMLPPGPLQVIV
jgi:hypothetical protein